MEEARLEPSVLGSIIPNLDPDPPDPARNNAFISSPSPTGAGSKRPVPPSSAADDASILGTPVSGKVEVGNSTGGSSGLTAAVGAGVTVGAARGGADEQEVRVAMVRKRKPRVKHGLRVLLRGTSRYGVRDVCITNACLSTWVQRVGLVQQKKTKRFFFLLRS